MKKILLLAAIAASFSSAYADGFSDCFKLSYEGETIAPGQTITVSDYCDPFIKDNPEFAGMWSSTFLCKAEIYATNLTSTGKQLLFRAKLISPSEWPGSDSGALMMCYDYESIAGNCLLDSYSFDTSLPAVKAGEYIMIDVKQENFTNLEPISFEIEMKAMDGANELGSASVFVNFTHQSDTTMAVGSIETDSKTEYFTIQGMPVSEPRKGQIYIQRKGAKVSKLIF